MFDWFFTPNNTSSKVIAITIGTIKYCYNNYFLAVELTGAINESRNQINLESKTECLQFVEFRLFELIPDSFN